MIYENKTTGGREAGQYNLSYMRSVLSGDYFLHSNKKQHTEVFSGLLLFSEHLVDCFRTVIYMQFFVNPVYMLFNRTGCNGEPGCDFFI